MGIDIKNTQDAVRVLAFSKAFKKDATIVEKARNMVEPGEYNIEGEFEVSGTLVVGTDTEAPHTRLNSAPKLLAIIMAHLRTEENWSPQKTSAFLSKVIDQAVDHPDDVQQEDIDAITRQREIAMKRLVARLEMEPRKGQVRFNGEVSKPKRHKIDRVRE